MTDIMSQSDIMENKAERYDFYVALGVIVVAAFFVLSFLRQTKKVNEPITAVSSEKYEADAEINGELLTTEEENESSWFDEDESEKIITDENWGMMDTFIVAVDFATSAQVILPRDMVDQQGELARRVEEMRAELQESLLAEQERGAADLIHVQTESALDSIHHSANTNETKMPKETLSTDEGQRGKSEESERCSIAVGIYSMDKNIRRQLRRLKDAGLDAEASPINSGTKISVKTACSEVDQVLRIVHKRFARDAFIEE